MIGAMMIHTQLTQLFIFIDLLPDARRQEQQLQEESHGMIELNKYYAQHYHLLSIADNPPQIDVFGLGLFKKPSKELTPEDKMRLIQYGMTAWIEWERQSKVIYEDAYNNLIELSEVAAAEFIMRYVRDVDQELKDAEMLYKVRDGIGWDLPTIYDKQARLGKR
jgi:hypothetical protein